MTRVTAEDVEGLNAVLLVAGRKLRYCVAYDAAAGYVEVDLAVADKDGEPVPRVAPRAADAKESDPDFILGQRLYISYTLHDATSAGFDVPENTGRIYWTGAGWLDEKSQPIDAPMPLRVANLGRSPQHQ